MSEFDEYYELLERYGVLARSGIRDYDFYCQLRADGVSNFLCCCLLRDLLSRDLTECIKIKTAYEGYTNSEIQERESLQKPDRGVYCPKCECHIPMFHSICPETELEIRAISSPTEQMNRVVNITGCPVTWAKIWAIHPEGPHRRFGDNNAPLCSYCGKPLRTAKAKQCVECGADWH